ncbi:hypothetical protein BDR05DRAFT_966571 [Suillus weaverae]|nr:hypothetical protein BDR05DRAFT_966571 [Suillus weaverae]
MDKFFISAERQRSFVYKTFRSKYNLSLSFSRISVIRSLDKQVGVEDNDALCAIKLK